MTYRSSLSFMSIDLILAELWPLNLVNFRYFSVSTGRGLMYCLQYSTNLFMHNLHAKPQVSRKLEEKVRSEATSSDRDSAVATKMSY